MTWDPEIDDPITRQRPRVEGEPGELGREPEPVDLGLRDTPPDLLAPIDPNAPVSGHRPPPAGSAAAAESVERDWSKAQSAVMPILRSPGTEGLAIDSVDVAALAQDPVRDHRRPLVGAGPAGLVLAFVLPAEGFDVLVTAEHLLEWGIDGTALSDAAQRNLARWSANAPWSTEEDERGRRIVSSASGDRWDAGRVLVADARAGIRSELGSGRILVGLPDRDLLVAARLTDDDPEFAALFASFVADQADAADEPIDRRVFELAGDDLVVYAG
jgi:hypothetical protein